MGYKAACILSSLRERPRLAECPPLDPDFTNRIAAVLPVGPVEPVGRTTFEEGVCPNQLTIGAYGDSLIIGDWSLCESCLDGKVPPVIQSINNLLPGAITLALGLHSVVNYYGYALFRGTELVRVRSGSADDGVIVDRGEWLPEEHTLFAKSEMRDGERIFFQEINGQMEEFDHSSFGEEFVFELSARFFGERLDRMENWNQEMVTFAPVRKPLWKRLFGR